MSWTISINPEVVGSRVTAIINFEAGESNKHYRTGKVKTFDIANASAANQANAKGINPNCKVVMVAKFKKDIVNGSNSYSISSDDSDMTAQLPSESLEEGVILAVLVKSDGSKEIKAGKGTLGDVKKGGGI